MATSEYIIKNGKLKSLNNDVETHYCPGCEHGTITRAIAMAIDKLNLYQKSVMIDSVGCSVLAYNYLHMDHVQAPHGRASAIASSIKLTHPELNVFTVQGDGDALAIGLSETIWAATRGIPISVFLVNNSIYGMTGGQMAPTTVPKQVTTTSVGGRDTKETGNPIDICKLLQRVEGASYVKRVSMVVEENKKNPEKGYVVKNVLEAYRAIENAFKVQQMGGYAFVEILSTCSVNWKMSILDAKRYSVEKIQPYFPLGTYVDKFNIEKQ
ncbi:MAG: thiamine pyrophosphate-dependent enzyme [Thermoplasmata archaeon]